MQKLFPQRYQNITKIGEGGTAVVYSAWDTTLERKVAIKRVKDELTQDENFLKRVEKEVKVLAKLKHPSVPTIFDFHFETGNVFYVMQFIEGVTLKNLLENQKIFELDIRKLFRDILQSLAYLHKNQIIHRDLKPSNIMIDSEENLYLTDYGIVHLLNNEITQITHTNTFVGTPLYSSPEQIKGEQLTFSSDLYSLGIIMYEMLSGNPPFQGNVVSIINGHLNQMPAEISLNYANKKYKNLLPIINKLLEKSPKSRFQSAWEVLNVLNGSLSQNLMVEDKTLVDTNWKRETQNTSQQEKQKEENLQKKKPIIFSFITLGVSILSLLDLIILFFRDEGPQIPIFGWIQSIFELVYFSSLFLGNKKFYTYLKYAFGIEVVLVFLDYYANKNYYTGTDFILGLGITVAVYSYLYFSKEVKKYFEK
ncbi:MAG: serine/threonine protein kinase [Leptospiraceae bacterium]|nr:serine/threonine protein kinase [Leptospiraceae bacterium]